MAGSITAQGRDLTKTMNAVNEDYWFRQWHLDFELHNKMGIKEVTQIPKEEEVSIYADTDSLFVSFKPAMDHSTWKSLLINKTYLESISVPFIVFQNTESPVRFENKNCIGNCSTTKEFEDSYLLQKPTLVIIDGEWVKDRDLWKLIVDKPEVRWNWSGELDFIMGLDHFRYAGYFKKCLEEYADSFGVENKEDFELERISESIINLAKKKYIQHIVFEDGQNYDRLTYIFPKGVELVRSSTPAFARDKVVNIVKYIFSNPEDFNIKDLLKLVKNLRKEFELSDIDDISMQSSCSNYSDKVINDNDKLEFVTGAHFAVKASAYHNHLLHKNHSLQQKYEFIKSGHKIKYYYCKDIKVNPIFAFTRGSFPMEFAPEVDYDTQFFKCILSPINSIIQPLGLPEITKRLSVVIDIFGSGF